MPDLPGDAACVVRRIGVATMSEPAWGCIDRLVSGGHGPGCVCFTAAEPVKAGGLVAITKYGAVVQVTRDMLLEHGLVQPTPAEQAERDAWHVEYERRKQAATEAAAVFVAALAAVTDPVARAVLDLHEVAERRECHGCDADGYEWEYPEWPCRTTTTVAAALGITVPPDLHLVTIADNG